MRKRNNRLRICAGGIMRKVNCILIAFSSTGNNRRLCCCNGGVTKMKKLSHCACTFQERLSYPFTAPWVKPCMNCFCIHKYSTTKGKVIKITPAKITVYSEAYWPLN